MHFNFFSGNKNSFSLSGAVKRREIDRNVKQCSVWGGGDRQHLFSLYLLLRAQKSEKSGLRPDDWRLQNPRAKKHARNFFDEDKRKKFAFDIRRNLGIPTHLRNHSYLRQLLGVNVEGH